MRRHPTSQSSQPETLAGSILVAHPSLSDANFRRTVILVAKHDDEGALGIVLNRPLEKQLGQLGPHFADGRLGRVPLFQGGPVEEKQVAICAWREQAELGMHQLMFGIDLQLAAKFADDKAVHMRAFLGYAGWSAGQLEQELSDNAWLTDELRPELLGIKPDITLWRATLGHLGPEWELSANEPDTLGLN